MTLAQMTKHEGGRYHDGERFLPWYTGPCLEWLMTLDLRGKYIYEYGCGDSTDWFISKMANVFGVDNKTEWVRHTDLQEWQFDRDGYIVSIKRHPFYFDIVINDGVYRDQCTEEALNMLKPGGYLIIDNYKQSSVLMDWPLTEKLIEGMEQTLYKEPGHADWQTLVVKKP